MLFIYVWGRLYSCAAITFGSAPAQSCERGEICCRWNRERNSETTVSMNFAVINGLISLFLKQNGVAAARGPEPRRASLIRWRKRNTHIMNIFWNLFGRRKLWMLIFHLHPPHDVNVSSDLEKPFQRNKRCEKPQEAHTTQQEEKPHLFSPVLWRMLQIIH